MERAFALEDAAPVRAGVVGRAVIRADERTLEVRAGALRVVAGCFTARCVLACVPLPTLRFVGEDLRFAPLSPGSSSLREPGTFLFLYGAKPNIYSFAYT